MTLRDLLNRVNIEDYLIGDAKTEKILSPEDYPLDRIWYCKITTITAMRNTPVIWIDLGGDTHAIGVLDI